MTNVSGKLKKLYVIGNGFDLWHGIPSSYREFKSFVREHDRDLFDAVETYLAAEEDWSDLEFALASIVVNSIIEDLDHFMVSYAADDWYDAHHHDFQYEVERVVERLSVMLRSQFGKWIRQLAIPTRSSAGKRLQNSEILSPQLLPVVLSEIVSQLRTLLNVAHPDSNNFGYLHSEVGSMNPT